MENIKALLLSFAFTLSIVGAIVIFLNVLPSAFAAEKEQIIINPNNIKNLTAYGETLRSEYPENYPPSYLFDGLQNSYSFWTQQGKAGFDLVLNEKINKPVCSIEVAANQPANQPFTLFVNDKNVFSGTLNSPNVQINSQSGGCFSNITKISMDFAPSDPNTWTTLSEVKLFSNDISPPPTNPPTNITKITITNSKVQMDVIDSEVTIVTHDDDSKVTTIPKTVTPTTTTTVPDLKQGEDNDAEEEDDEDDDNKKKEKDDKN